MLMLGQILRGAFSVMLWNKVCAIALILQIMLVHSVDTSSAQSIAGKCSKI